FPMSPTVASAVTEPITGHSCPVAVPAAHLTPRPPPIASPPQYHTWRSQPASSPPVLAHCPFSSMTSGGELIGQYPAQNACGEQIGGMSYQRKDAHTQWRRVRWRGCASQTLRVMAVVPEFMLTGGSSSCDLFPLCAVFAEECIDFQSIPAHGFSS